MSEPYWIRLARPDDADAISGVQLRAGLAAWSGFLGAERIEDAGRDARHPADLVAVDADGVFAFVGLG